MGEFLVSVCKGVYPVFFLFAAAGIVLRIRERKWTAFDTLLAGAFTVYEVLTALLPWCFYGTLTISRRCLLIGAPLYFPFAAMGFFALWKYARRRAAWKYCASVLLVLLVSGTLWSLYSPVVREYTSEKKALERKLSFAASAWIRQDWNGRRTLPLTQMKCDEYQSGKRPLVESEFQRIGYLCGGQQLPEFLKSSGVRPDYTVSAGEENSSSSVPAHVLRLDGQVWFIYRNCPEVENAR